MRESWFVLKMNDVDVRVWGFSEEACRFVQLDDDDEKKKRETLVCIGRARSDTQTGWGDGGEKRWIWGRFTDDDFYERGDDFESDFKTRRRFISIPNA